MIRVITYQLCHININKHAMRCGSKVKISSKYVNNMEKHISFYNVYLTACYKHLSNDTVYAHNSYIDEHISQWKYKRKTKHTFWNNINKNHIFLFPRIDLLIISRHTVWLTAYWEYINITIWWYINMTKYKSWKITTSSKELLQTC